MPSLAIMRITKLGALCVAAILGLSTAAFAERVDWSQYLEPPSARTAKPKTAAKPTPKKVAPRVAKATAKPKAKAKAAPRSAKARPRRK
jgi:hypothetical protein